ncbi:hypothetical protein D3C74_358100 [compost metagenome]
MNELIQRGGQSPLQQHRFVHFSHGLEQFEVMHIPRANLNHVHIIKRLFNMPGVDNFTNGQKAVLCGCFPQNSQAVHSQSLKIIRGGTGFEGSSAHNLHSGLLQRCGNGTGL